MKATISRTALAIASMLVCLGTAQAEELNFSELESRLSKIESQLAGQNGLQQAGYSCDNGCCDSSCCCESSCGCESGCCGGGCSDCCSSCGGCGSYYAEIDLMWARLHVNSNALGGKLSENHQVAPRFIVGYENCRGEGARLRYWNYDHSTDFENGNFAIDVELNVLDIEATKRIQLCRTDVVLAGGFRYAGFDLVSGGSVSADLYGLTMAVDIETLACCRCNSYWSGIYGGRMSILGGDWEGGSFTGTIFDDNVVVTELYGGWEYGCCRCGYDLYTQVKFEMQNWASDVISDAAGTTLGFVGPTLTFGVGF